MVQLRPSLALTLKNLAPHGLVVSREQQASARGEAVNPGWLGLALGALSLREASWDAR